MFRLTGQSITRVGTVHAASVADLRTQLRLVDGEESDTFLNALIDRAAAVVERATSRILTPATVKCLYAGDGDKVTLGFYPVSAITSVTDGADTVEYTAPGVGYAWRPTINLGVKRESEALEVTATAGYASGTVPPELTVLVLTLAADFYEHPQVQEDKAVAQNQVFQRLLSALSPIGVR